jgi:hypothetical protein
MQTEKRILRPAPRPSSLSIALLQGVGASVAKNSANSTRWAFSEYSQFRAEQLSLTRNINALLPTGRTRLADNAVDHAWKAERVILKLGGKGTRMWTAEQGKEIIAYGRPVERFHGHHINSVEAHPLQQADADNIAFLTPDEHLDAHRGNWQNPTKGKIHNRGYLIKQSSLRHELSAFGLMAAVGFGIGLIFSIGVNKNAGIKDHVLHGLGGAATSGFSYAGGRVAAHILLNTSLSETLRFAGIGLAGSIVASICTFVQLKRAGVQTKKALGTAGTQLGVSVVGIFLTAIAKLKWGAAVGPWVALAFSVLVLSYGLWRSHEAKETLRKLEIHEIILLEPSVGGGV